MLFWLSVHALSCGLQLDLVILTTQCCCTVAGHATALGAAAHRAVFPAKGGTVCQGILFSVSRAAISTGCLLHFNAFPWQPAFGD